MRAALSRCGSHLGVVEEERTAAVLARFRRVCRDFGVRDVVAVATAAVRQADNGEQFVARLRARTGMPLRLLGGVEEAELGFLGMVNTLDIQTGWLADVGGGSTEVTAFRDRQALRSVRLPLGAINLGTRAAPVTDDARWQLNELRRRADAALDTEPWLGQLPALPLVGIGGTFRALARLARRRERKPRQSLNGFAVPADLPAKLLAELGG